MSLSKIRVVIHQYRSPKKLLDNTGRTIVFTLLASVLSTRVKGR